MHRNHQFSRLISAALLIAAAITLVLAGAASSGSIFAG
jgi:hypothetical protein